MIVARQLHLAALRTCDVAPGSDGDAAVLTITPQKKAAALGGMQRQCWRRGTEQVGSTIR